MFVLKNKNIMQYIIHCFKKCSLKKHLKKSNIHFYLQYDISATAHIKTYTTNRTMIKIFINI